MVTGPLSKNNSCELFLSARSSEHLREQGKWNNRSELRCRRGASPCDPTEIKTLLCRYSSVVEHTLGKGGVASPILASGTIKKASFREAFLMVMLQERTCGGNASAERIVGENEC